MSGIMYFTITSNISGACLLIIPVIPLMSASSDERKLKKYESVHKKNH
uniref:Uncharacterized protein n=1 Tax=Anguilla anguilla TaxID=7936 RepID=A0A0E9WFQ7_ANGAN